MILTDGTNTFTTISESIREQPIINGSSVITNGGRIKSMANSQRLRIVSSMRLTQTEVAELSEILTNWTATLTYTPSRKLWDKTSIEAMEVIVSQGPTVDDIASNGCEATYFITITFEESA